MLAAGLSTSTIVEFQSCVNGDGSRAAAVCRHLFDRLHAERERIDAAIAELEANRTTLDQLIGGVNP